ncbi:MAG: hypothetical protein JNK82_08155, partial [Myxococcaceae bacterium]|nr:hypothetical protein [Myxococcaceae bacterium]
MLDELRTGEKVSEGRFRIDQQRALEKLRKSRLAQPAEWVNDVLRAAQASGAKHVTARTDADDVELSFDGRPFPAAVMKNLLAQALGTDDAHDDEPRYRLLALGVAGAMGVGLKRLFVQSGRVALEVNAAGEVEVKETEPSELTVVKARKKVSLQVAAALLFGKKPEAKNIYLGSMYLAPRVTLDGKAQVRVDLPKEVHDGGGLQVYAKPYPLDFSLVRLVSHGVSAGVRYWRLPGLQLEAIVKCDALRSNASGSDVVDTDPNLEKALGICRKASLALLKAHVSEPSQEVRAQLAKRLREDEKLDPKARALIETMPLFPGPSGERWSIAALKGHTKNGRPLFTATTRHPKGSYPNHTVLLDAETLEWEALLPQGKREDVAALVRRNQRAAENKLRWESQAPEVAALPPRDWLATEHLVTAKLKGEVAIPERGHGAFVRVLANGRFLQEGEVPQLAPLRLRAVVDLQNPVSEKLWAEIPNPKLWSAVVDEVLAGAELAIGKALEKTPVDPAAFEHARDLLLRRSPEKGSGLPRAVVRAPLFECLGEPGRASLDDLRGESRWRYVTRGFDHPALDGRLVLVLNATDKQLLMPYANGKLTDVTERLERERDVRRRLAGPKQRPVVLGCSVTVPFVRGAVRGEVGVATDFGDRVDLTLYRDGFQLEHTFHTPRYGPARAAVESAALQPNADWSKAVRDPAFDEVLQAVHEAQRQLVLPLLERFPTFATMPVTARAWVLAFARRDLTGTSLADDVVVRTVRESKLLDGPDGPISLAELKTRATKTGHLYLLPGWR